MPCVSATARRRDAERNAATRARRDEPRLDAPVMSRARRHAAGPVGPTGLDAKHASRSRSGQSRSGSPRNPPRRSAHRCVIANWRDRSRTDAASPPHGVCGVGWVGAPTSSRWPIYAAHPVNRTRRGKAGLCRVPPRLRGYAQARYWPTMDVWPLTCAIGFVCAGDLTCVATDGREIYGSHCG